MLLIRCTYYVFVRGRRFTKQLENVSPKLEYVCVYTLPTVYEYLDVQFALIKPEPKYSFKTSFVSLKVIFSPLLSVLTKIKLPNIFQSVLGVPDAFKQ